MTRAQNIIKLNPEIDLKALELNRPDTIILGVGNKSRGDDGLGWAFLKEIECQDALKSVIEYRFLLLVEDADLIADYSQVIFVDATHEKFENGFSFERTIPGRKFEFSTHIIPPSSILYLTHELYESYPHAWTLAISGEEWGLGKGLSKTGKENLRKAVEFFKAIL